MFRLLLLSALMVWASRVCAQTDSVAWVVSGWEARTDHPVVINEVKASLKRGLDDLTVPDRIAVKSVLVHKYIELQQWDSSLNFCQQQVAAAHQAGSTLEEASFYKLIGNIYYSIRDKVKAREYWRKAISIAEPNNYFLLVEQSYHNLAAVEIDSGVHYQEAEEYLMRALQLGREHGQAGTVLYNQHNRLLATLYERTNQLNKAEALYLDVIAKSRAIPDTLRLAESLMFYCDVLTKQNKFDKAIQISTEAVAIARRVQMLDLLPTALAFHAKNLSLAGRYKEAYDFKVEEAIVNQQRFNNAINTQVSEAEAKFKNAEAEHEKRLAIMNANKEKQVYTQSLIAVMIIAGLIFYTFYQRKTARQKLQLQAQVQTEKERLSRDLHDNLGSQMALLSNNIETLQRYWTIGEVSEAHIGNVQASARQLLQILRETIWILNKENVMAHEFFDKLVDYAKRYVQSYNEISLLVKEDFSSDKKLGAHEALQLFRICQEAITNACKYAHSASLELTGKVADNSFAISIADRGQGFDMLHVAEHEHYGLKNMQLRAKAANITCEVNSVLGQGTVVRLSI